MNILVIKGSPHKKGTTALLAEQFIKGAEKQGHQVNVFDAAKESIHPCIACDHCRTTPDGCVFKDGMEKLNPLLLSADLVVFVTPLYYFGISTQLKAAIDRFYANNTALRSDAKKAAILSACGDSDDWAMDSLKLHYETICKYLHWDNIGGIYAKDSYLREDIEKTDYPKQAYDFGSAL